MRIGSLTVAGAAPDLNRLPVYLKQERLYPIAYASSMDPALLATAHAAVDAAARVLDHYWAHGADVRLKADATPVTQADEEAESAIREVIAAAFPDHGFYGEEHGRENPDAEWLWLIDPLDGTKSFVRRQPFFSTQLALLHRGARVLGVSNAPRFGERAHAVRGEGAWLNGERLAASACATLEDAALSTGNLRSLAKGTGWTGLGELVARVDRTRGYGDFFHYHQLAAGGLDVVIESDLNILDVGALATIVEEAGGRVTDLRGGELTLETTSVLATNGHLHDTVLEVLWN